jgi:DNA polymerase V
MLFRIAAPEARRFVTPCIPQQAANYRGIFYTAHLSVFVETNRFKPTDPQSNVTRSVRLPIASADTGTLVKAANRVIRAIYQPGFRYKKAGVMLLDLAPAARVQGDLWTAPESARSKSIMKALDRLNAYYGRGTC